MVASLREFGDHTLVLTLLRGLCGKFRTLLLLEEIDLNDVAIENDITPSPAPTALVTGSSGPPPAAARSATGRAPSGGVPTHGTGGPGQGASYG
jgi:hypothetical protein